MNQTTQLDIHPDAESLNAFAEQALPVREREQIVAHLAGCSRCRQVIFLARQEAAGFETKTVFAAGRSTRARSWLSGWGLAWIPAAALAGVVGLVVLVHGRHEETGTETARAVTPVAPQNAASAANPAVNNRVVVVKPPAPVSHVMEKPPEIKMQSIQTGAAYEPVPESAAPAHAAAAESVTVTTAPPLLKSPRNETVTVTAAPPLLQSESASVGQVIDPNQINATPLNGRNWVYMAQLTDGQKKSAAPSAPQPPTAQMHQRATGTYLHSATEGDAAKVKTDDMEGRTQASRKAEARYGGTGGASTSQVKTEALPGSSFDGSAPMRAMQFEAAREKSAGPAPLPSGLAIVSSVTAQNRTLAIDQAGALFLSRDSGSHWEQVFRQWSGRAVDVSLLQYLNGSSVNGATFGGAAASTTAPAAVFELRNDKNLIWVSTDGMIWTAR